jgi:hypothetical protein
LKPSNDIDRLGVTGALTLMKRLSETKTKMTIKMTYKRNLLPSRPGSA